MKKIQGIVSTSIMLKTMTYSLNFFLNITKLEWTMH
jgi:hypothetical protein